MDYWGDHDLLLSLDSLLQHSKTPLLLHTKIPSFHYFENRVK